MTGLGVINPIGLCPICHTASEHQVLLRPDMVSVVNMSLRAQVPASPPCFVLELKRTGWRVVPVASSRRRG